jgi:hypothetical protein
VSVFRFQVSVISFQLNRRNALRDWNLAGR